MQRTVWTLLIIIGFGAAGFLLYRNYQISKDQTANADRAAELQEQLATIRSEADAQKRKAAQEAEARMLAEKKANDEREAEARRLAQARQEAEAQQAARQAAEDAAAKSQAELDRARAENARIEAAAQKAGEERARQAEELQARLAAAQRALQETERTKNAEIERQAALIASYSASNRQSPTGASPAATTETSEKGRRPTRIIFPSDYKRASHYYLPLLPSMSTGAD